MKRVEDKFKIGISFQGFCEWQGGIDFCMNFLRVLDNEDVKVYCFVPYEIIPSDLKRKASLGIGIIKNNVKAKVVYYKANQLKYILKQHNIDIIFPLMGSRDYIKNMTCVGYIADLQHKKLPQYFSRQEIFRRDKEYTSILNIYEYVLVNSKSVKRDIEDFYNPYKAKIIELPCVSIASKNHTSSFVDFIIVKKKYKLPKKYFLISNQFWLHKNHDLAFEAFEQFYNSGNTDVHLVCTGKMEDYRDSQYISRLLNSIEKKKCKNNILLLGLIPKKEQLVIMRNAIALIQPTKFEGGPGGGAVYDAMAMQLPCIVSNIDINLELPKSERIQYFNTESSEDLAKKMKRILECDFAKKGNVDIIRVQKENKKKYGEYLIDMFNQLLEGKNE